MFLKLAIEASLPLIHVHTRDVLNFPDILDKITKGQKAEKWDVKTLAIEKGKLYFLVQSTKPLPVPWYDVYRKLVQLGSSMIVVNGEHMEPMFDAGEVPVPKDMMVDFMKAIVEEDNKALELTRTLGGCTLKEAAELARLTMARDNSLTPLGLMETRKTAFQGQQGLTPVTLGQLFYEPPQPLAEWVAKEAKFFLTGGDPRLIPRGLLFDGPPGTGKTAGAKWVAHRLEVPLYRLDIGETKNKYVGNSEGNMRNNLARLDHEEPCVLLIDEVEKVFRRNTGADGDSTSATMMGQLLWWLAERRSRVLVIMTTNNAGAIPPELHRDGRIDDHMWFNGLDEDDALDFTLSVMLTFKGIKNEAKTLEAVKHIVKHTLGSRPIEGSNPVRVSQASLTNAVYDFIKAHS